MPDLLRRLRMPHGTKAVRARVGASYSSLSTFAVAVVGAATLLTAVAPSVYAQTGSRRYNNILNQRFNTISDGPQSALIVDAPRGGTAAETDQVVTRAVKREWAARARAMNAQTALWRRMGVLKNGAFPMSTIIRVRDTQTGRLVTPPASRVTRAVGNGEITFKYTGFSGTDEAFLRSFVDLAYPRLVNLYGKPSWSGVVEVVNTGNLDNSTIPETQRLAFGAYNASENKILQPVYASVDSFASAFLLNMVHAFHGPAVLDYDAWEQGMARAAAAVIARDPVFNFQDATANNLYSALKFYDLLNQPALGNNTFFPPSQRNIPIDGQFTVAKMLLPRLGMSGAVWLKAYIENQGFFRQFNEAYYAQYDPNAVPRLSGNVPLLRSIAGTALPNGVEGVPFQDWFQRQYILDTAVTPGGKLYAYATPGVNGASDTGQSASVALVHYRTASDGDEALLAGRAYATYFDNTNARLTLGGASEQANIVDGEGFITTLAFPTQGFDAGRLTMDFNIAGQTTRTYLPSGFNGDFQGVVLGPESAGTVAVNETTISPIVTRNQTATISNGAFGVNLGTGANDLGVTVVSVTDGGITTNYRFNTGDGQYYAIIRPGSTGGAVTTLRRTFASGSIPQLISLPLRPLAPRVDAALNLPATDFLLSYWDPTRTTYDTFIPAQPSVAAIESGRGYWLKVAPQGGAANVEVAITGTPPASDTDLTVQTPFGWNLVGSPFGTAFPKTDILVKYLQNDAVSWTDAVASNYVADTIYEFNPQSAYVETDTLNGQDWKGYWLRVLVPQGVTLLLPGPDSVTGRSVTRSLVPMKPVSKPDWSLRLRAREEGADLPFGGQASATLGAAKGATRAFDNRLDREAPPAIVPCVSVDFPQNGTASGGRFVADYRDATGRSAQTWPVNVYAPTTGRMSLTWEGLNQVPRDARLTLVDKTTNQRIALRGRSAYTYVAEGGKTRAFEITVDAARTSPLALSNLTMSRTRAANGASGGWSIAYTLTDDADVTVDLSALGGKLIRRLDGGRAQAGGRRSVYFDGRAQDGASLPAGPYTLTIRAKSDDGSQLTQQRPLLLIQ